MVVQLRLLSGRARLGSLLRHFSPANTGLCELCSLEVEDLAHFLLPRCPRLQERADVLHQYMLTMLHESPICSQILNNILTGAKKDQDIWLQFVLDCSVMPEVISAAQADDSVLHLLFKITRTWCYSLHRTRLKLLGRWT